MPNETDLDSSLSTSQSQTDVDRGLVLLAAALESMILLESEVEPYVMTMMWKSLRQYLEIIFASQEKNEGRVVARDMERDEKLLAVREEMERGEVMDEAEFDRLMDEAEAPN